VIGTALRLVFGHRAYILGTLAATVLTAALYAWAGQIVTWYPDGTTYVDTEPTHLGALLALSLLMGLVLPMQAYALRRAAWGLRQGGTGLLGFVAGLSSLTCCSPLLVPAVLSFAGFSGSALLTLNTTLYRYFVPLAALSAAFLLLSLVLTARDITRACALTPRQLAARHGREQAALRSPPRDQMPRQVGGQAMQRSGKREEL
jgi:hypothetical protein